jgi:hypothetical protein
MSAKATIVVLALLSVAAGAVQAGDFADGLQAFDGGDYAEAASHWQPLAEQGDALAQVALAELYLSGLGVARDDQKAVELFRQAALQGHGLAQLNFADFAAAGRGRPRDPVVAYTWYMIAARQGVEVAKQRWLDLQKQLSAAEIAAAEAAVHALQTRQ